jgi:hypothetical protein
MFGFCNITIQVAAFDRNKNNIPCRVVEWILIQNPDPRGKIKRKMKKMSFLCKNKFFETGMQEKEKLLIPLITNKNRYRKDVTLLF